VVGEGLGLPVTGLEGRGGFGGSVGEITTVTGGSRPVKFSVSIHQATSPGGVPQSPGQQVKERPSAA
jgi:hypothetical protein